MYIPPLQLPVICLCYIILTSSHFSLHLLSSSLDLVTLTQPHLCSPVSHIFEDRIPTLSLSNCSHFLLLLKASLVLLPKYTTCWVEIITMSCAFVPLYSHAVMILSLTWVSHLTRPISVSLFHSLNIHFQASSSSTRSCSESVPSFSKDNHVYFTGTLPNMCCHMSSVSCSRYDISLHSPHCSPYPFQPTFCLRPGFHLFVSLEALLCSSSPDCFKLASIDYFHILHQTLIKSLHTLFHINSVTAL